MCVIAGYAGNRRAAPILIDMLRKEQFFDGGLSTGIATIHEGKLYTAKVLGDLDTLLENTDALNFPGTVGIIHSRPDNNLQSHAHPFTSEDGLLAAVLNGTLRDVQSPEFCEAVNSLMVGFRQRGFTLKTACSPQEAVPRGRLLPDGRTYHYSEALTLMLGDLVSASSEETIREDLAKAMVKTLSAAPADIVMLAVHALAEDTVTAGVITRPMNAGFGDGETYLATSAIAFPEEIQKNPILPLPPTSVAQISPKGLTMYTTTLSGVRSEQINARIADEFYRRVEAMLVGKKDDPVSIYDMPAYTDWRDIWTKPYVDCKFKAEKEGLLKPYAAGIYQALWTLHKEGRLHSTLGTYRGAPMTRFWVDE